ncbi:unnamed protein product [Prunus armeniaca]|uniref:Uncharacterized protein n=1 Tax=Prunus armeniaca TaxID=36596 RepID=A0A6J5VLR3_PRUAR|nr:unnamed protein product [Prunus armeniaca]
MSKHEGVICLKIQKTLEKIKYISARTCMPTQAGPYEFQAYEPIIHPVKGFHMWPRSNQTPLSPPLVRKQPGRPRRSRKKDHEMEKTIDAIGANFRRKRIVTCTRRFQKSHNKMNCKNQPQDPPPGTYIDKRWTTGYPSKKKRVSETNASTYEMNARGSQMNVQKRKLPMSFSS